MTNWSNADWVLTVRQTVPRLTVALRHMRPTLELPSPARLDPVVLARDGVSGIIWDVDGTLMAHHAHEVAPEVRQTFDRLLATPVLRHVILSNCGETRYLELGSIFPHWPVLRAYRLRGKILYRTLYRGVDSFDQVVLEGFLSEGATVMKKPSVELIEFALRELGLPPSSVTMIGDQFLTDVVGANLGGISSIKVDTLDRGSFPLPIRLFQHLEMALYFAFYRGRPQRACLP